MKSRFWVLGVVLVFLGLMIFSSHGSVGQTAPGPNVTGPLIMWDPGEGSWIQTSRQQLLNIIDKLRAQIDAIPSKGSLTTAMISQIADVYGDNGNLTGYDGWTLRGKREISLYFTSLLACHKIADLKIEMKFAYAKEFTDTFKNPKKPEDIVHCVYFILCISYVLDGKLVSAPGFAYRGHQAPCQNIT